MTHRTTLSTVLASSLFMLLAVLAASLPNAGHAQSSETPKQCALSIMPATIDRGQSATIAWEAFPNLLFFVSSQVSISPDIGSVPPKGSRTITPAHTTAYTMNASLSILSFIPISTYRCAATVTVNQPAVCTPTFSCSGNGVRNSCTGAVTQCAGGATCSNGQCVGGQCRPPDDCTPTFSCSGNGVRNSCTGAIAQCVGGSICLGDQCMCPSGQHWDDAQNRCVPVTLVAAPTAWGFASLIHWDASNANSCTGTGFNTNGATSGTVTTDPLLQTTTFTLICDTGTKSVTVVIDSCPAGYVGTPPVCTLASNTCPAGYTGTPPNCSVASSCPLNYTGTPPNCTPIACVPTNICNGNNVVNSCTGALIQSCAYSCVNGACIVPPPTVVSWAVTPKLVQSGNTTNVSWEVSRAASCTVTGTNGDSWTGLTGTKVSSPITSQTIFTLNCIAFAGSAAPNVTRTATVNIVPVFQEK